MSGRNPSSGVSAIVLAAGMSRRMGTPKQLLQIGGKPLLQVSLENVRASRVDEIILVLGFAADRIAKEISLRGIKVVRNEEFEQGMGMSLRAGLVALDPKARAALIVLADQPLVRATTLDRLIDFHSESGGQIIIPTYRGFRGNPVLLDRSVFPELRELSGDVGCRAIFGSHTENIRKLPVDDIGILQDLDSVDDYQKLKSRGDEAGKSSQGTADGSMLEGIKEVPDGQPQLVLVGHDEVVQALARLGRLLGFGTTVVDPLLSLADIPAADRILRILDFSRMPAAKERYAVVASRGQFDEEAIAEALRNGISYVALLANKKRAQELSASLRVQGVSEERLAGIRAPAGLNIGAKAPEEIALSIMAEIVSVRNHATGKPSMKNPAAG